MFVVLTASLLAIGVMVFILGVRTKDLPQPEPVSPFRHLDERKAAIYDNLRDLQFEYRVGKLSDEDYRQTKLDLQKELAGVLAEVDRIRQQLAPNGTAPPPIAAPAKSADPLACPHCGAKFKEALKFCGECGKPMKVEKV
jgi:NADH pyrophosphatase NudC (nudix superfamily)